MRRSLHCLSFRPDGAGMRRIVQQNSGMYAEDVSLTLGIWLDGHNDATLIRFATYHTDGIRLLSIASSLALAFLCLWSTQSQTHLHANSDLHRPSPARIASQLTTVE